MAGKRTGSQVRETAGSLECFLDSFHPIERKRTHCMAVAPRHQHRLSGSHCKSAENTIANWDVQPSLLGGLGNYWRPSRC
ncbi:hypothetical protein MNKW57_24270 [Biformimicrobium ophioploci]|uniref:Uncharacterized protein n=1 Tax=Biformimicrobium ophioploci TaxID=3036711 RepID=A0ABQ6M176_9GAMM|nr:hypothetical protein MNKW57_24270 [Microbulbifer sp. NKW57]